MKQAFDKIFASPVAVLFLTLLLKVPVFLLGHVQEDAFITWRVAGNFAAEGVIGFNAGERISASTTHLYVFISAFFYKIFSENFILPLLIFSSLLFAIGSFWLAKIIFPQHVKRQAIFVLFLNATPPALTASCLGMEYGILFFLYCGLLYFGLKLQRFWAFLIFPVLLLWTRMDAVLFLGVFFLADVFLYRKIRWKFILGGLIGLASVVLFNYLYFGELANHTISAKKIAYQNLSQDTSVEFYLFQWAYYGGLIKKYSLATFLLFCAFLGLMVWIAVRIWRDKTRLDQTSRVILLAILIFALLKISVFAFFRAYFDWYYWLPRTFVFAVLLFFILRNIRPLRISLLFLTIFCGSLYVFQLWQSWAVSYMERGQRMQVAADLNRSSKGKNASILLEPAGIIPFYTGLYTYDEVGLVNKEITHEMLKNGEKWWSSSVARFRPDFILTVGHKPGDPASHYQLSESEKVWFDQNYQAVQTYPIEILRAQAPLPLRWIYGLRPLGKDYFLYQKSTQTRSR